MVIIRSVFSLKRIVILLTLMTILLYSIAKLRNNIPIQWKDQKIQDILKILIYWQRFPLNDIPIRPINSSHSLSYTQLSDWQMKSVGHYRNFYSFKIENAESNMNFDQISEMEVFLNFQPLMSNNERNILLYTFYIFQQICKKHGFEYFAIEGTLLGVYRHMGIIPWDDDMDVIMDASKWTEIRDALSGNEELSLHTDSHYQWKIFLKSAYQPKNSEFKWPFIDIFFYKHDKTHIIGLTPALKLNFIYETTDIFPLISKPFENSEIYVPKKIDKIVPELYGVTMCQTNSYIHKQGLDVPNKYIKSIPCSYLYNLYPFVFRSVDSVNGKTVEELKLDSKIITDISFVRYDSQLQCR
ncbi:hypothetical protein LOTGIDRAFT_164923 [Lottia gigantea]|uniref:LicD/FKTN/FKRP nucleotidyltransferase domain-containing protein n=1 Tax=Lottia gigantea TaxID=225164 RepID=V4A3Q8_LOTGI|nr:hypothetical protein LOTGIDRAFT_164923 [Lottia gigantea]ESO89620.1 hypothetical protein LOTGIDRAFT_164923 [Lottia gigantea]